MPDSPAFVASSDLPAKPAVNSAAHTVPLEEEVVALFDQFRHRMLFYVLSFGLAIPDGEEILQEVFLALFQHLRHGKSRDNIPSWLFRVAHNLALKRRSRNRRDAGLRTEIAIEDLAVDPAPGPEDRVLTGQVRERVLAVIEALPEQDRRCLSLRAEGLRYREIAGILDMSLGAVSLALSRSLARITRSRER